MKYFKILILTLTLTLLFSTTYYGNEVSNVLTLNPDGQSSTNSSSNTGTVDDEGNVYLDKSVEAGKNILDVVEGLADEYQEGLTSATQKNYSSTAKVFSFMGCLVYIFLLVLGCGYLIYTLWETLAIAFPIFRRFEWKYNANQQNMQSPYGNQQMRVQQGVGGSKFWSEDFLNAMAMLNGNGSGQMMQQGQMQNNSNGAPSTFSVMKNYLTNRFKLIFICLAVVIVLISPVGINLGLSLFRIVFKG